MRSGFSIILIVAILFGGGYFYYVANAVCPAPLAYSVGEIDPSFGLSLDDVRLALSDAENVWEDAVGQNLFIYDADAAFTVNFIYDERQEITDAEGNFKEKLNQTESVSDAISQTYAELVSNYNDLQIVYSDNVEQYEKKLATYNTKVQGYNDEGGATKEVYEVLQGQKAVLDAEQNSLNDLSDQLNDLVRQINAIGEQGNVLVDTYNKGVAEYNHTFGESREFTQGTYSSDKRIDIYSYADASELRLVLAHEFGHALSLDHVADEKSVMYFLIGKQPPQVVLSPQDMDEFIRVCSKQSFWSTIQTQFTSK